MDHLIAMQLEASHRQEVAHRWAERRNLLRAAGQRGRPEMPPDAREWTRWWKVLRRRVTGWLWQHARRAAATRSSA